MLQVWSSELYIFYPMPSSGIDPGSLGTGECPICRPINGPTNVNWISTVVEYIIAISVDIIIFNTQGY